MQRLSPQCTNLTASMILILPHVKSHRRAISVPLSLIGTQPPEIVTVAENTQHLPFLPAVVRVQSLRLTLVKILARPLGPVFCTLYFYIRSIPLCP